MFYQQKRSCRTVEHLRFVALCSCTVKITFTGEINTPPIVCKQLTYNCKKITVSFHEQLCARVKNLAIIFTHIGWNQVYAALLVLGIKEIDEENRTMVAKAQPGEKDLSEDGDYSRYMGWIIDDFPGTIEQVSQSLS